MSIAGHGFPVASRPCKRGFGSATNAPPRLESRSARAGPPCHGGTSPHRSFRRGVTILELLIALSISAMLLVATAVAVDASFRAYQANQEQSSLMQRARIAIDRITTVIRTTKAHQPDSPSAAASFTAGSVVTDTGIDLFDINNVETIFRYDAPTQRVLAIVGGKTYVLASGVTAFSIKMEPMRSAESIRTGGSWDLLQRATLSLTVKTTGNTAASSETTNSQAITLSASVMPRPNTW